MERVLKLVDLPRRSDIQALNENLERVAEAVDRLEQARRTAPGTPASAPPAAAPEDPDRGDA